MPHKRFPAAFVSLVSDGTLQPAAVSKPNGQTYSGWQLRPDNEASTRPQSPPSLAPETGADAQHTFAPAPFTEKGGRGECVCLPEGA